MQKLPKTQYSAEFREQAVRARRESGLSVEATAKSLSLPNGTLRYWVKAADKGKLLVIGQHQKPLTEPELELSKLRRALAETRMERDLLKKCVAYFAKESR